MNGQCFLGPGFNFVTNINLISNTVSIKRLNDFSILSINENI